MCVWLRARCRIAAQALHSVRQWSSTQPRLPSGAAPPARPPCEDGGMGDRSGERAAAFSRSSSCFALCRCSISDMASGVGPPPPGAGPPSSCSSSRSARGASDGTSTGERVGLQLVRTTCSRARRCSRPAARWLPGGAGEGADPAAGCVAALLMPAGRPPCCAVWATLQASWHPSGSHGRGRSARCACKGEEGQPWAVANVKSQ